MNWRVGEDILDPLHASCLCVASGESFAAIFSLDLLYVSAELTERLRQKALSTHGIPHGNIVVCATHTHAAPSIVPDLFEPCIADTAYIAHVSEVCENVLAEALKDARPARIEYGAGPTNIAINRRRRISTPSLRQPFNTRMANRPNSSGANDATVYVVRVCREGSPPLYIIAGACHPSLIRGSSVSADYPGLIRVGMSKVLGTEVEFMFLQGFSGNLRARILLTEPFKLWPPETLRRSVFDRHTFKKNTSTDDAVFIAGELARNAVAVPLRTSPVRPIESNIEELDIALDGRKDIEALMTSLGTSADLRQRILFSLDGFDADKGGRLHLQRLTIGDINIVASNAEMFTEYAIALAQISDMFVVPVGYANGMIGYVPDSASLQGGGYEPDRARVLFGTPSRFSTKTEQAVLSQFRKLFDVAVRNSARKPSPRVSPNGPA
jgi:hypothetical protein